MSFDEIFKKRIVLPGTASQRFRRQIGSTPVETDAKLRETGRDYAKKYIKEEERLYESKQDPSQSVKDAHGPLSEVDTLSNLTSLNASLDDKTDVFVKYPVKRRKHNKSLPIFEQKDKILNRVDTHKVVIIKGATGCGKTTQVPQFILNAAIERNQHCNIVVTQPRRIAAISVAKRVAEEMGVPVGSLVGYQVGLDKNAGDDTRILYCTTGVLLQKFINQKHMKEYTHVILDEIHERDQEMDFLLLVVRKLLNLNSKNVKVVLMSATIETRIFSDYFFTMLENQKYYAIVLDIPENKKYDVITSFLDGFKTRIPEAHGISLDINHPEIERKCYLTAVRLIQLFDSIDEGENKSKKRAPGTMGSVLVFLPGLHEIEEMESHLHMKQEDIVNNQWKKFLWKIIPLHSSITHDEQQSVFRPVEIGYRKIILSTNIAESSITVEDIDYIIDFCLTKTMVTDPITNFCHLKLEWSSKNSLEQRAGRVGRVSSGRVFRLITEDFYNEFLEQETVPEMLRCPLDHLVLQAKLLDMGEPISIFANALSPPYIENIEQTILSLKEIGALLRTVDGKFTPCDGDLTVMGRIIAKLPLDVHLGKLIFFGSLFNVLDECIVMACALSVKNVFSQPFKDYLKSYNAKLTWADSTCSDCIAFYNVYTLWRKRHAEGVFGRNKENQFRWAKDRFIELKTLREIAVLQKDIDLRLKYAGITRQVSEDSRIEEAKKALFIKLAIAGAFYPHYFFRGAQGGQIDEREAVITLNGHDPYSTVYLQGMPPNQPAVLYKRSIQQKFSECSNRANVFVDSSSKVYINFGRSQENTLDPKLHMEIPGKITLAVYRAVKMRQQPDFKFRIPVLNPIDADKQFREYQTRCEMLRKQPTCPIMYMPWPWYKHAEPNYLLSELIEVFISHVESPSHFWVQSRSPPMLKTLMTMGVLLNEQGALEPIIAPLKVGALCAALYEEDNVAKYYRCRILSVNANNTYDIFYIDYGNTRYGVEQRLLRGFGRDLVITHKINSVPDLAVECSLAKIQPPRTSAGNEKWPHKAITIMKSATINVNEEFAMKVYSFVNNVANVKLKIGSSIQHKSLNEMLVKSGNAEKCEESYLSILSHEDLKKKRKMLKDGILPLNQEKLGKNISLDSQSQTTYLEEDFEPARNECSQEVVLRGPFSPLEMRVYGATQCSIGKMVRIESMSVNSVLLDTNPSDSYERMVVASFVSTNEGGDKLTLRSTTIMPNIPGLPALVCLMFAPMVELRSNESCTKLSGALCGLGYHESDGEPLFPENDIELVFDVELTLDEIVKINKIRHTLNLAVCGESGTADIDPQKFKIHRHKLISQIGDLFKKQYELQELNFFANAHKWNQISDENLMNPCSDRKICHRHPTDDVSTVYRLIWGINLDGDSSAEYKVVAKNMQQLQDFALGLLKVKNLECILCRITVTNGISAKLHLKSSQHKVREKHFDIPKNPVNDSRLNRSEYR